MSKELKNEEENIPGTMEDLRNVKKFWDHYKVPIRDEDMAWVDAKINSADDSLTFEDKKRIQFIISYGHTTEVEVFKDVVFKKTNENARKLVYSYQFDKDIDNMLKGEDKA